MPRVRLTKEQIARRAQRQRELQTRVAAASRPSSGYLSTALVAPLLQHLSDGLQRVLMARPLDPLPWLSDYLRHACKLGALVEQDPVSLLVLEMHRKRRVLQLALQDSQADELVSKTLIRAILVQQEALFLADVPEEQLLTPDDHVFLATNVAPHQSQWSVDVTALSTQGPVVQNQGEAEEDGTQARRHAQRYVRQQLLARRHMDSYLTHVLCGVTQALVALQLAAPEQPAEWLVRHLSSSSCTPASPSYQQQQLALLWKTNHELARRMEVVQLTRHALHDRRKRLHSIHTQFAQALTLRSFYEDKLTHTRLGARTQAVMAGTLVVVNGIKHWIAPGFLLEPAAFEPTGDHALALRRAERVLMARDEERWRFLLTAQSEYDAATRVQSRWRAGRAFRAYQALVARRRAAAALLQRNYMAYLFHRAVRLPSWCVLGREVVVAPSVAAKCGITFQFYRHKDFPAGNYRRVEVPQGEKKDAGPGVGDGDGAGAVPESWVNELMALCRFEDECAGFSTDGALKRFVPRQLSQLQRMAQPHGDNSGLYIKVYPGKLDRVVTTALVTQVPVDRFGLITVVLDGTAVTTQVPVGKLSDRWRRRRVQHPQQATRKVHRRTIVFGLAQRRGGEASAGRAMVVEEENAEVAEEKAKDLALVLAEEDAEDAEEEEEEEERTRKRLWRRLGGSGGIVPDPDPRVEYVFEDRSTQEIRRTEPVHTFPDPEVLEREIESRRVAFHAAREQAYEAKVLASAVRLQCAWRSKRARAQFRAVLALRAKERARDQLVADIHDSNAAKRQAQRSKQQHSGGWLGKWRRR